jgi:Domain of unknown function (DUF3885)
MQKAIEAAFGTNALGHALFYNHHHALRFELSGGSSYIHMFLQAYQRAAEITDFLFSDAKDLHAAICFYGKGNFLSSLSVFRSISSCKLKIPKPYAAWVQPHREDDEFDDLSKTSIAFKIDRQIIPQLLWGALANEIGVRPRLQCDVYLFDLELGILVHPYDERGMDAIGSNQELLQSAYKKFDRYLLDYDRAIMSQRFKSS